ncbi:MAG: hypothetical protein ACXWOW_06195 [Candidatus Limnocylindrales bacterium]
MTHPRPPAQGRRALAATLLALTLLLGSAGGAGAADPTGRTPATRPQAVVDWCADITYAAPGGSGAIVGWAAQSCFGSIYRQQMDQYLDVCVLDLVICWQWYSGKLLRTDSYPGAGYFRVPWAGTFRVSGLKHGLRHRIRTENWSWSSGSGLLHATTTAEAVAP